MFETLASILVIFPEAFSRLTLSLDTYLACARCHREGCDKEKSRWALKLSFFPSFASRSLNPRRVRKIWVWIHIWGKVEEENLASRRQENVTLD